MPGKKSCATIAIAINAAIVTSIVPMIVIIIVIAIANMVEIETMIATWNKTKLIEIKWIRIKKNETKWNWIKLI